MRITTDGSGSGGMLKRLGWFCALWLGSVLTIASVAAALRWIMHAI